MFLEYLKKRKLLLLLLAMYLTTLVLSAMGYNVWLPSCPIYEITGHECVGCGSNRAMISILNLHLQEAWELNKLVFLYIPLLVYFLLKDIYKHFTNYQYSKEDNNYGKI